VRVAVHWTSLEAIRLWGVPVEVDGSDLTLTQARVLAGMVGKLMVEAEHSKEVAVKMALEAFRRMYERSDDGWRARRSVEVHGGKKVRNRHYVKDALERRADDTGDSGKAAVLLVRSMLEAGRRNSGQDRSRIAAAMSSLLDVLDNADQEAVLRDLGKRLGASVRLVRRKAK